MMNSTRRLLAWHSSVSSWQTGSISPAPLDSSSAVTPRARSASTTAAARCMWRLGDRHGQGVYTQGRRRYVGDWADDRREGHGFETYASGDEYEGAFVGDHRQGLGEYRYVGGSHYRGSWQSGNRTGFGQYTYANGDRHEGLWRSSVRHGYGSYRFANGRRLVGEWRGTRRSSTPNTCAR
jgi:hypothetical protein